MFRQPYITQKLRAFVAEESGSMTTFGLFIFTAMLMMGGLALDTARQANMLTLMQNTADSAGAAAMIVRLDQTESASQAEGLRVAERNMPNSIYGVVMTAADIEFGIWNGATKQFTPQAGAMDAVRVRVNRTAANQNPLQATLMRFLGIESFDLTRVATVMSFNPACLREGFVAENIVDMQSNNAFTKGFCIHSNRDIKVSSGNSFETDVSISMPQPSAIQLPNSGFASNTGLEDALEANRYNLRIVERLNSILTGLQTPGSRYIPAYITSHAVIDINSRNISEANLTSGRIHRINCSGNQQLAIANNAFLQNVVIVTNCRTSFGNGARMENAILATSHIGDKSINGPNGVQPAFPK